MALENQQVYMLLLVFFSSCNENSIRKENITLSKEKGRPKSVPLEDGTFGGTTMGSERFHGELGLGALPFTLRGLKRFQKQTAFSF